MKNNPNIFAGDKGWIEEISAIGVFEEKILIWIEDYKNGSLAKEDILNVTRKVAEYRRTPDLIMEIKDKLVYLISTKVQD